MNIEAEMLIKGKRAAPERAIFVWGDRMSKTNFSAFDRLYLGDEFCERCLPSVPYLKNIIDWCNQNGLKYSLVIPFLTDWGISKLRDLLELMKKDNSCSEVVVNDYGTLGILEKEYKEFRVILGRIMVSKYLSKFHTEDWAFNFFRNNKEKKEFFCYLPDEFIGFLKENRIFAVECNSYRHAYLIKEQLLENDINLHIYYPYTYLTATRHCRAPEKFKPGPQKIQTLCNLNCIRYKAILKNPFHVGKTYVKGNAYFRREDNIPKYLSGNVNRIIFNDFLKV